MGKIAGGSLAVAAFHQSGSGFRVVAHREQCLFLNPHVVRLEDGAVLAALCVRDGRGRWRCPARSPLRGGA